MEVLRGQEEVGPALEVRWSREGQRLPKVVVKEVESEVEPRAPGTPCQETPGVGKGVV